MTISPVSSFQMPVQFAIRSTAMALSVGDRVVRTVRRAEAPHLFLVGATLSTGLSESTTFRITAHVVALFHTIIATCHAVEECVASWAKCRNVHLIPSGDAIVFMAAARDTGIVREACTMLADRLLLLLEYFYETLWKVVEVAFSIYRLASTVLWSEETAEAAREDILINLQQCGKLLFDEKQGNWRTLFPALEGAFTSIVGCVGLNKVAEPILNVAKKGLEALETTYRHMPSSQRMLEDGREAGRLMLRSTLGV